MWDKEHINNTAMVIIEINSADILKPSALHVIDAAPKTVNKMTLNKENLQRMAQKITTATKTSAITKSAICLGVSRNSTSNGILIRYYIGKFRK